MEIKSLQEEEEEEEDEEEEEKKKKKKKERRMAVKFRLFKWKILMNNSVFSLHPNLFVVRR